MIATKTQVAQKVTQKRRSKGATISEFLVFTLPLLVFLVILYGALLWNVYVSMSNWISTAPDYTFSGLKWYQYLFRQGRVWVDVQNNLKWLILGVVPTTVLAIFLAYLLELARIRGVEAHVRTLILYPLHVLQTGLLRSRTGRPRR